MTDFDPNFRALCWELINELHGYKVAHPMHCRALLNRALTALATPPPEPPTVMEILELSGEIEDAGLGQIDLVRAALKRWAQR